MNLIIPMAGMGKRLRPHTLTIPKPLIPIAGKPIVQRLVEDIAKVLTEPIEKIAFVIGEFGDATEKQLLDIAASVGAQGSIHYQREALGTAHAIHCARELMEGKLIVAFADTLFKANFTLDAEQDGIIWVKQVENPSAYGVVNLNMDGIITDFVEKPADPKSDLAIIGIYYFKDGEGLGKELDRMIDQGIMVSNEFQLTSALEELKAQGVKFAAGEVADWLDCGNKEITVASNSRYLAFLEGNQIHSSAVIENTVIIPPVYIGANAKITESVIGPGVSVGEDTVISGSIVKNCLIQTNTHLQQVNVANSMIGNFVKVKASPKNISLGDYSEWNG